MHYKTEVRVKSPEKNNKIFQELAFVPKSKQVYVMQEGICFFVMKVLQICHTLSRTKNSFKVLYIGHFESHFAVQCFWSNTSYWLSQFIEVCQEELAKICSVCTLVGLGYTVVTIVATKLTMDICELILVVVTFVQLFLEWLLIRVWLLQLPCKKLGISHNPFITISVVVHMASNYKYINFTV